MKKALALVVLLGTGFGLYAQQCPYQARNYDQQQPYQQSGYYQQQEYNQYPQGYGYYSQGYNQYPQQGYSQYGYTQYSDQYQGQRYSQIQPEYYQEQPSYYQDQGNRDGYRTQGSLGSSYNNNMMRDDQNMQYNQDRSMQYNQDRSMQSNLDRNTPSNYDTNTQYNQNRTYQIDRNYNLQTPRYDEQQPSNSQQQMKMNQSYNSEPYTPPSQQADKYYADSYSTTNHPANNPYYNTTNSQEDRMLEREIRNSLSSGWFSRGYDQISVSVNNGEVALIGTVNSWEDKNEIERKVRNMRGVRNVNSQIAVKEGNKNAKNNVRANDTEYRKEFPQDRYTTPADLQLNIKIRDKTSRGWLWNNYTDVTLNTANGVVTLEGFVEGPNDRQKLIDEIRKIEGVQSVQSNLKMKR